MGKKKDKLLFKMARSAFKSGWKQFLAIIGIGGIAINLFIGLLSNAQSFETRVNHMYQDGNVADLFLTLDMLKNDENDEKTIQEVASKYGKYEKRFYTLTGFEQNTALCAISYTLPTISKPSNMIKVGEKQTDANFFIIDELYTRPDSSFVTTKILDVGEICEISINTTYFGLTESQLALVDLLLKPGATNPFRQEKFTINFEITGIMKHPENISRATYSPYLFLCSNTMFRDNLRDTLAESFTETGLKSLWSLGFKNGLGWGDGDINGSTEEFPKANQYLFKTDNGDTSNLVSDLNTYFESKDTDNRLIQQTIYETSGGSEIERDKTQSYQLAFAFPVIFFLVAILIILTTFRQLILRDRSQIGTLKGLGFKNKEIYGYYFLIVGAVITISFLIGAISGPFIIPLIMEMKYKILYTLASFEIVFPYLYAFLTYLIYLGLSILITFYVAHKEINLRPVESMRPKEVKVIFRAKKYKEKEHKHHSSLYLSSKLAFRNIISDPVKSLMVLLGMLGCTALLCCGFGIEDTLNYGIATDNFINSGADLSATYLRSQSNDDVSADFKFKDDSDNLLMDGFQPYTRESLAINHESSTYSSYIEVVGKYIPFVGDENVTFTYEDLPTDQVLLSRKVARKLNVKAGDTINFEYNGERIEATVYRVFEAFYGNGIIISGESTLFSEPITSYKSSWIKCPNENTAVVKEKVTGLAYVGSAETTKDYVRMVNDAISSISIITNAVKVFAILLAVIALYNLGLMNFNERIREIATMKVLGFKKKEVSMSLLIETLTLTFLGAFAGLFFGMPFMTIVLTINEVGLIDYIFTITTLTYVFSFLFTFLVGVIINGLLMLKIKKVEMIESLKSVE